MYRKLTIATVAVVFGMLIAGSLALAATKTTTVKLKQTPVGVSGTTIVKRNANGANVTVKVTGVDKGHAVTVWVLGPDGQNGGGHVVGASGKFNFGTYIKLKDPAMDSIRLVVLDHGEAKTGGALVEQIQNPCPPPTDPNCDKLGEATHPDPGP